MGDLNTLFPKILLEYVNISIGTNTQYSWHRLKVAKKVSFIYQTKMSFWKPLTSFTLVLPLTHLRVYILNSVICFKINLSFNDALIE